MCRYVKRTRSSRSRPYSGAIGSFTLSSSSAPLHASSTETIRAPARSYASSANELPSPAPRSTSTSWPRCTSSRAPAGVSATRYSSGLISLTTATLTRLRTLDDRSSAPAGLGADHRLQSGRAWLMILAVRLRKHQPVTDPAQLALFGRRITEARLEAGLTKMELAEKLGVPLAEFEQFEAGGADPPKHFDRLPPPPRQPPASPGGRGAPGPRPGAPGRV